MSIPLATDYTEIEHTHLRLILEDLRKCFSKYSDTGYLDALVLLAELINKPRAWILGHPESHLSVSQYKNLIKAKTKIEAGIPLPYILGKWEFYGLDFFVTPEVLIPRPETELLIEVARTFLAEKTGIHTLADVGTGSGIIAVTLAASFPDIQIIATDISSKALQVARRNAITHQVSSRIHLIQADLLPVTSQPFDMICANLPYIPSDLLHTLDVYEKEPVIALDGGENGLALIELLITQAKTLLAPSGILLIEIEASQGQAVKNIAKQAFQQANIRIEKDLAGKDRLLIIEK
ncbi:MAG TPA: peptide chain release factor N(5)-glutamine methyltransferase [Anaerolineae bacterium]|nr:peptide chain release factor N(5)-glutamine methyltransferase [Anaerolineae bacterium]